MKKWQVVFFISVVLLIIFSMILRLITNRFQYVIVGSNTGQNQVVGIFHEIDLTFSKDITDSFFKSCQASISPNSELVLSYEKTILKILPKTRFKNETKYTIGVSCDNNQNIELNFATKSQNEATEEEIQLLQTQLDREFSLISEEIEKQEPWRNQMPISSKYYIVIYSSNEKIYLAESLIPKGSKITRASLEKEIKDKLSTIGAPSAPIVWR